MGVYDFVWSFRNGNGVTRKTIISDKSSLLGNASRVLKLVCHTVNAILFGVAIGFRIEFSIWIESLFTQHFNQQNQAQHEGQTKFLLVLLLLHILRAEILVLIAANVSLSSLQKKKPSVWLSALLFIAACHPSAPHGAPPEASLRLGCAACGSLWWDPGLYIEPLRTLRAKFP